MQRAEYYILSIPSTPMKPCCRHLWESDVLYRAALLISWKGLTGNVSGHRKFVAHNSMQKDARSPFDAGNNTRDIIYNVNTSKEQLTILIRRSGSESDRLSTNFLVSFQKRC